MENVEFNDDKSLVSFKQVISSADGVSDKDFKAKMPNFQAMGFWNKVRTLEPRDSAWMALTGIIRKFAEEKPFKQSIYTSLFIDMAFSNDDLARKKISMIKDDKKAMWIV